MKTIRLVFIITLRLRCKQDIMGNLRTTYSSGLLLVYIIMWYTVTVNTVSSLIQIQPVWRQHSGGENPEALSLLHCVLLLWIFSIPLTCRSSTVWSSWQKWAGLVLLCSSFLCWSNVRSSSHVGCSLSLRHTAGRTSCMI